MRRVLTFLSIIFLTCGSVPFQSVHAQPNESDQFIVMFQEEMNTALIKKHSGKIEKKFEGISSVAVSLPSEAVHALRNHPQIKSVEKDHVVHTVGQTVTWGLQKIQTEPLFDTNLTGNSVKIAVIDTGIDLDHEDLKVTGGVSTLDSSSYDDDNGHGTHVAGVISAVDNNVGVVGVAPEAKIYAVKALGKDGAGYESNIIAGIEWAIENDMDIINMSIGSPFSSPAFQKAIEKASDHGILLVAAAGNDGESVNYPGRYHNVISVGAVDVDNGHPSFSSIGDKLEIVAPGVDIMSTYPGGYVSKNGTSMAAPYVTGVLALYKQVNPDVSGERMRNVLHSRAIDLGEKGKDDEFGYGLVQMPDQTNVDITNPSIPGNVTSELSYSEEQATVHLTWQSSSDNKKVAKYNIYRGEVKLGSVENLEFLKSDANYGTNQYQIQAVDVTGNQSKLSKPLKLIVGFTDLNGEDWFYNAVNHLVNDKIIEGYSDRTYRPAKKITRAEAATMVGRALGLKGTERKTNFPDVPKGHYASGYIQSAYEKGMISGYPDGTFKPGEWITREEVAYLMSEAYHLTEEKCGDKFSDVNESLHSYHVINRLCTAKVTEGYPNETFRPDREVTRAEYAVFVTRADKK